MDLSLHLVSDLDGTWIPPQGDVASLRALENHLAHLHGLTLTFATGRTLHSVLTDLAGLVKLWPQHFVTDVGTAIYHRTSNGKWIEDADYARKIDSRWSREAMEHILRSLPEGIRPQPGLRPRRRLALEVIPGFNLMRAAEKLTHHLAQAWFPAHVLPSNGRCLDVLPRGVDKGTAIEHLESRIQRPTFLLVCGDSENDLGMFQLADLAVLMADSPLKEGSIAVPISRLIRPKAKGPAGILEVLSSLHSRSPSAGISEAPAFHSETEETGGAL